MSDTIDDEIVQLRNIFICEAEEEVEKLEETLICLEEDPTNLNHIGVILRTTHTIKGSSASVGFSGLSSLAHELESLFVEIQKNNVKLNDNIFALLLKATDDLKTYINGLKNSSDFSMDVSEVIEKLGLASKARANHQDNDNDSSGLHIFDEPDSEIAENSSLNNNLAEAGEETGEITTPSSENEAIRVPLKKIDNLLNCFGEQVILQALLESVSSNIQENENLISKTILQLGKITYDLQQNTMSLRMVNLNSFFQKIKRSARDTASALNKKVKVHFTGADTELDKTLVDRLNSVISHIIRNAVDHGIEDKDGRISSNKEETGNLYISAYQEHGSFYLKIQDDGKGLNKDIIFNKALASGLIKESDNLTPEQIYQLILRPGFSTKETITDISGRGVGLDAVYKSILGMRGELILSSNLGGGTTFLITLPLSMSIFNGIIFEAANSRYILPSSDIKKIYKFYSEEVRVVDNKNGIIEKDDKIIPLMDFSELIKKPNKRNDPKKRVALLVNKSGQDFALEVDEIIGNQRIVQKNLGLEFKSRKEYSGGAILNDGNVALIINLNNLIHTESLKKAV